MTDDERVAGTYIAGLSQSVHAANTVLASMRKKDARWWSFSASHTTFELIIGEPTGKDNIVLSLGCGYLKGPVRLANQEIEIGIVDNHVVFQDESVGFRAECSNFRWRQNFDILACNGVWIRRGNPAPLAYEDCMQRIGQRVRAFYDRKIGYRELNNRLNAFLWYQLPILAEYLNDRDPRLDDN